ncbi:MAG: hypothetical protein LN409_05330, partial [Candidatus Thermoplasmatota archaeon]|nr:hypothetical protein [Candidatus Thermoplasmatota archaeon]
LLPDKNTVNVCGLYCTPMGMSFPRGLGYTPEKLKELPPANGLSGCCFAGRRDVFLEIGGFDESFFMYNEDSDLSWRAHLKGIRIATVPASVAIHHYSWGVDLFKLFHLERNRYFILRKHMPLRWIVLYLPSLISVEFLSLLAHCRFGVVGLRKKKDAWIEALNRRDALSDGNRVQLKHALIPVFPKEPTVTGIHAEYVLRNMLSGLFRANWRLVK